MPPIIYKMDFVDRKKFNISYKTRNKNLSDALNYIKRKKAIEKNVEKFNSLNGQLKYISRDNANSSDIIYFNKNGAVRDESIFEEHLQQLDEHSTLKKMCLYRNYISFDEATEEKILKNFTQEETFQIIQPILEMQLMEEGFNLDNVVYSAQFHTNTKHLHMHFDFFEKVPTKKKNKRQLEVKEKYLKKMNFMLASNDEQKVNILDQQKELRPKIKNAKNEVSAFFLIQVKIQKLLSVLRLSKKVNIHT